MFFLRRLRGILGTSVLWALVWALLGCLLLLAEAFFGDHAHHVAQPARLVLMSVGFFGVWGAVSGGVFALALAIAERRRSIEQLSMWRVGAWGAIGGAALPALGTALSILEGSIARIAPQAAILFAITALLGALCATGTVAIARRGATDALSVER